MGFIVEDDLEHTVNLPNRIIPKKRRPRKQPLKALGDRRIGKEFGRKDVGKLLLRSSEMSNTSRQQLYTQLSQDLHEFIRSAGVDWQDEEECRRFSIFGDCITCSRWRGSSLVSGMDIVKVITAMYRLSHSGLSPRDRRRFEESVISDLRGIKVGKEALLEPANSPLLNFLYRINSVRTHKRQKVYKWESVDFERLYQDACEREDRATKPDLHEIIASHPSIMKNALSPAAGPSSPSSWGSPLESRAGFNLVTPSPMPRKEAKYSCCIEACDLALLAFASEVRNKQQSMQLLQGTHGS